MVQTNPNTDQFATEKTTFATSTTNETSYEIIYLEGRPIPVTGLVTFNNLATFQRKFTVGEPSFDSDDVFSVWIQSDWTGGGQSYDLNELSDVQKFYFATAETRYPHMLTLPPLTSAYTVTTASGDSYPLGDYKPDITILFWAAFNTNLCYWDTGTTAFVSAATLSSVPVNKGVVFDDVLWIPQGTSGYDLWNGTAIVHKSDALPVSFCEWDDKLLALETNGQVRIFPSGASAFDPADPAIKLQGDRTPRNLVTWWDQSGNPTVYIVTNRDVWAIDPIVPTLYRTGLHFPVHPDQGLGSVAWRDDAMYVSVGVGVHQLSRGNVVSAMGLDHNDGLPSEYRGAIVDLEGEYNGLLALVKGIGETDVGEMDGDRLEETQIFDDSMVVPTSSSGAKSTLQRWTGQGWHTVWVSSNTNGNPTRVMVSEADGEYRLWWGYGTSMYTQPLRRTFYNPKDGAELGIDIFENAATLLTGKFDANMSGFLKLASHVEVDFDPLSTGSIDIYYRTDTTYPNWVHLGMMTGTSRHFRAFDPNNDGFAEGITFNWIEFQYNLAGDGEFSETPIIKSIVLKFTKIPILFRSWSFSLTLDFPEAWVGRGPKAISDDLNDMTSNGRFVTFKHLDQTYRVRVSQVNGKDATGKDHTSIRTVNLIELGLPKQTTGQVHTADSDADTVWVQGW